MTQMICENVSLGYEGKAVVSNLSFKVESGDYLCVVGENGAGKSTLIKTILSLEQPLSGKIVLSGGLKRLRRRIFRHRFTRLSYPAALTDAHYARFIAKGKKRLPKNL